MAGASCGYFLAEQAKVVLLEREEQPGYHTTGRSAALFYESYGNAVIRRITKATRAFLESPPEGFAAGPILTPRGMLTIATEERSEEHTSELQSLMRNSYAVLCLKKKKNDTNT